LRERLQTEKKSVSEIDANLQSELSRIGQEMARFNAAGSLSPRNTDVKQLADSVQALEKKIPGIVKEVHDKHDAFQRDMESSLRASEAKVRAIDQLYKEAMAENELLYEKFNGELGKLVKALKGKGKEDKEELVTKMKESGEELARVKKENARLKREMASLRSALKSGE
jgi:chromosome segregation ATPase